MSEPADDAVDVPVPDVLDAPAAGSSESIDAQGWYRDPFAVHEARWFSAGHPTALVRDGGVESDDEPPAADWPGPLELIHDDDTFVPDEFARAEDPPDHRPAIDEAGAVGLGWGI